MSRKPAPITVLLDATVIDGTGRGPVPHAVVVLEGDRIKRVGPLAQVEVPDGALTIKLTGKWIVPGLVDAHIHFFQSAGLYTRPDLIDFRRSRPYEHELAAIRRALPVTARRYLASGVTAVVDMGGPLWSFEVRVEARDWSWAPRIAVAGQLVSTVARPALDLGDPPIIEAKSPDEARRLVRAQLEKKPDLIKIWFIVPPKRELEQLAGIVRAATDEAHQASVRVAVHATELSTARAAVEAGADILVHGIDDAPVDQAFIGLLKARDVLYIPTLAVDEGYGEVLGQEIRLTDVERRNGDPAIIASWGDYAIVPSPTSERDLAKWRAAMTQRMPEQRRNLRRVHEAGVTVAAGTDAGNIGTLHGPALHRELQLMVEAGMSPQAVLVAATRNAARVFADPPPFGTVQPGKLADLLVVDGDPARDVRHLQRIHRVVRGGVVWQPSEILPPSPAYVVQRQIDAFNARDLEAFVATYAPDAVLVEQPGGKVLANSHAALRDQYGRLFRESPDLRAEVLQRIALGNSVVDHELVTGIEARPPLRSMVTYEVVDGLIRRVTFRDADPAASADVGSSGDSAPGE